MLKRQIHTGPAISENEISVFENKIKVALPADYRTFLLRFNGGNFIYKISDQQGKKVHSFPVWLYMLNENAKALSLYRNYITFLGRLPKGVIPIGENEVGDRFCLVVDKNSPEYGTIWDWNRKFELKNKASVFKHNMIKRFKDFTDLFKFLEEQEEDDDAE